MLNANGKFSCVIPLSNIFGFCRDIRKVIFGASHTVVLQRRGDSNLALWRTGGDDGTVNLTKLALWMLYMTPSLAVETRLLSFMDSGGRSLLSWHEVITATTTSTVPGIFTWQIALTKNVSSPRHVFVALQHVNKNQGDDVQLRSHMIFDKFGATEVSL